MPKLLIVLLILSTSATAQTVHICQKDGKQIMTDHPCNDIGATTKQIRTPESYKPLSGGGGLSEGERRLMQGYKARDEAQNRAHEAAKIQDRQARQQEEAANSARCMHLDREKKEIVAALRQNSTQWLNDRHRAINDELYRLRCQTL